ncbi:MAG: ABC transporter permease [Longimicrobiales bacterium]
MSGQDGARVRLARLVVAVASGIVGKERRSEWRREWDAELWVASERGRPVVRDALGAFRHALAVRRHARLDAAAASAGGSRHVRFSWLDVKLGLRMLAKYPGLSSVSVIGMSLAIAIGAGAFSMIASMMESSLPIPEGDRVVAVRNAILTEPGRTRASLRDFIAWRGELESVEDLATFTRVGRNLIVPGLAVDLVPVVRMTASGFRLARTAPLMGRPLIEADEREDARVVLIGFEEWQRRFGADPDIIGRRIGLGSEAYTIVGVMPEGFRFPVDDGYWIPLVFGPAERAQPDGVSLTIAGRLAEGATLESAQAELTTIGIHMARSYPETHGRLRPRVVAYTRAFFDMDSPQAIWSAHLFRVFVSLLLVVVAVNVAILVYARTATRAGEIAVRTALGASRARVVTQLFAEALVLSLTAALVGLAIADIALRKLFVVAEYRDFSLPFWLGPGLSTGVIIYALVLAIVGAAIVGVVPALKATGPRVQTRLQQLSGHGGRLQLGRGWTALVIGQVAVAVAFLPFAVHVNQEVIAEVMREVPIPTEEFLLASLTVERAGGPTSAADQLAMEQRFRAGAAELIRRIESDPAVEGVTVRIGGGREQAEMVSVSSGAAGRPESLGRERFGRIEADYFALHGMPMLAGRSFADGEAHGGATVAVVNQVFVEDNVGEGPVLGRLLRFVAENDSTGALEPGPWLEIVGVVQDFEEYAVEPRGEIYLPADPARLAPPVRLVIRMRAGPAARFAPRLRETAAGIDPRLQLNDVISMAQRQRQWKQGIRLLAIGTTAVTMAVLLLSAAGIYAMMSFTVTRRRREIGIRSALGAHPRRLLGSVFAHASVQLGAGMLLGLIGTVAVDRMAGKGPVHDGNSVVLLFVAVLMATVGLLAAIGPARRGLAIQPTEALREE